MIRHETEVGQRGTVCQVAPHGRLPIEVIDILREASIAHLNRFFLAGTWRDGFLGCLALDRRVDRRWEEPGDTSLPLLLPAFAYIPPGNPLVVILSDELQISIISKIFSFRMTTYSDFPSL